MGGYDVTLSNGLGGVPFSGRATAAASCMPCRGCQVQLGRLGGGNRSGTLYGETCVTRVVNVGPTSTLEGCRESTSHPGLMNRFKVDPHDLGQIDIGSPSNDIESKGPDVQRSSGRRCFFLHRLFPVE